MTRRLVLLFLAAWWLAWPLYAQTEPSASHLPRWRGFNLPNAFNMQWRQPFMEDDFRWIHQLGFNFVRIPLDYRMWIHNHDWNDINPDALADIDQVVAWGRQYGLHVCLNFHRAPGYCVGTGDPEPADLWTSSVAQKVAARHWALFAQRYRGIPSSELSFDLFNEPPGLSHAVYADVVGQMVSAIRAEDANRLIIADGLDYGRQPVPELIPLGVAQATRGYDPMQVSHYQAPWIADSGSWAVPVWPMPQVAGALYGPDKADLVGPLVLAGPPFASTGALRIHIGTVTRFAELAVYGDGKRLWQHTFHPGPGQGEWKSASYLQEYGVYRGVYDSNYQVELPGGLREVRLQVDGGDWLTWTEIGWRSGPDATEQILRPTVTGYGVRPGRVVLNGQFEVDTAHSPMLADRMTLQKENVAPWQALERQGSGVMVGEFGVWNHTPHDVAMGFLRDHLENWKAAGWGWALWNFRGQFGVLDSDRADVRYVDFHGHHLDSSMLRLLQEE